MENKIKFKVALQYYGCPYLVCFNIENNPVIETFTGKNIEEGMYEPDVENKRELLILKPLPEITVDDAIEVYQILNYDDRKEAEMKFEFYGIAPIVECLTRDVRNPWNFKTYAKVYQHLQVKGYDMPQYLLGGKTLKEEGMAIYNLSEINKSNC